MESNMRCGVNRKSQNTNVLLVHSELGRSKRVTFELPSSKDQTFVYGLEKPRDLEGARDVSMRWVEHQPNPDNKPGPDFIAMNKLAADEHVITSKDQVRKNNTRSTTARALQHKHKHTLGIRIYSSSSVTPRQKRVRRMGDVRVMISGRNEGRWVPPIPVAVSILTDHRLAHTCYGVPTAWTGNRLSSGSRTSRP